MPELLVEWFSITTGKVMSALWYPLLLLFGHVTAGNLLGDVLR